MQRETERDFGQVKRIVQKRGAMRAEQVGMEVGFSEVLQRVSVQVRILMPFDTEADTDLLNTPSWRSRILLIC